MIRGAILENKNQDNLSEKKGRSTTRKVLSFFLYPAAVFVPLFVGTFLLQIGVVPSGSMEPNYRAGSLFIGNRLIDEEAMERGDVVIFAHDGNHLMKRVIGLPGDIITFESCKVHVNGVELDESAYLDDSILTVAFQAEYEVPEGCYFMLGDNRGISSDSRFWDNPFVKSEDIESKLITYIKIPGWDVESP